MYYIIMNVFNRIEIKYLISKEQYYNLINLIIDNDMYLDKYKRNTIQTLYYDTSDDLLIRRSLDSPLFKEKIRIRNYGDKLSDKLYLEIKRKYKGIVYKRRIETNIKDTINFFNNKYNYSNQIGKEINQFRNHYKKLIPKMMIISEREAYYSNNSDLRITFDFDIRYRKKILSFNEKESDGMILDSDQVLLEIKTSNSYPLWLVRFLNDNKIFKTKFSKYGNAYLKEYMRKDYGTTI